MSILFTAENIGTMKVPNRFVCSATYEVMAKESGEVRDELIKRYVTLSKGEVGLCITGLMYVHPSGRGYRHQLGIHEDIMLPGLKRLTEEVHRHNGKIIFQLAHCGRQTTKTMAGQTPIAPSKRDRDPVNFVKPREMNEDDIETVVKSFGKAANRAEEAGADGIQIHAAHGYLVSEFLSPFFNVRNDSWGGSDENRFRFLKEIYKEAKANLSNDFPVLVKLNAQDYTPKMGVTPSVAVVYSKWLSELGVDAIEVSCGTTNYSFMNMCRGDVPTDEIVKSLSWWKKPIGRLMIGKMEGKFNLEEGYNVESAKKIKPVISETRLMVVGGMRTVSDMEDVVNNGFADFVSMSRPFIRDPYLVKNIRKNKIKKVSCVSCNRCFAAAPNDLPVYCYNKKFPI